MLRKKRNVGGAVKPVPIEHTAFYAYLREYNETMRVRGYSVPTLHRRESDIRRFVGWCDERGVSRPQDVTKPILERYQKHLFYYRQRNGEPLTATTQAHYLVSVRQFFKWLTQENHLLYNPASELVVPKTRARLPHVLSEDEVMQLLEQPDTVTPFGVRDRAILELFYSTGIRRTELINLQTHDLALNQHTLSVRGGKGDKDRVVPIGERALRWLRRYLDDVRPHLLLSVNEQTVFLTDYGAPFRDNKMGDRVRRYIKQAGLDIPGSCHLLRHACATHMLENGAELRYIQVLLGHSQLNSTEIYTHVSIRKLQEVHARTHPARDEDRAL